MKITQITATAVTRVPTGQYAFAERTFTLTAVLEDGDDDGSAIEILKQRLAQTMRDSPGVKSEVKAEEARASLPLEPGPLPADARVEEAAAAEEATTETPLSDAEFSAKIAEVVRTVGTSPVIEARSKLGVASIAQIPQSERWAFLAALTH